MRGYHTLNGISEKIGNGAAEKVRRKIKEVVARYIRAVTVLLKKVRIAENRQNDRNAEGDQSSLFGVTQEHKERKQHIKQENYPDRPCYTAKPHRDTR